MTSILFENDVCRLQLLTPIRDKAVILYITSDAFGDAGANVCNAVESTSKEVTFCTLSVSDWDRYLTPWKCDANMQGRVFSGEAPKLLECVETDVLPRLRELLPDAPIYLAGYSLAGLFALWSMYESGSFAGAACCSGSVWFPGWKEYAAEHAIRREGSIYLSLGTKEKNTKHPLMKTVEDNMRFEYEQLRRETKVNRCELAWNEGGHFHNTEERVAAGIRWLLESIQSIYR